jgi:hypothetical protein
LLGNKVAGKNKRPSAPWSARPPARRRAAISAAACSRPTPTGRTGHQEGAGDRRRPDLEQQPHRQFGPHRRAVVQLRPADRRPQHSLLASGVQSLPSYEAAGGAYVANSNANLRAGPSTKGKVVGKLAAGETFDALGVGPDGGWVLVGRNGYGVGYAAASLVRPVQVAAASCRVIDASVADFGPAPRRPNATAPAATIAASGN